MGNQQLLAEREKLVEIDFEILKSLKKRFEIIDAIGQIKTSNEINIEQPEYWSTKIDKLIKESSEIGLKKEIVEEVYKVIHEISIKEQKAHNNSY